MADGDEGRKPSDVAIVGGGFGGSILARVLASRGLDVVLVDRDVEPGFRIGESSTPLAGLALERFAERYGLDDLKDLATHGRWLRAHPDLMRGLKRGFTFYHHRPGEAFAPGAGEGRRLLVAASPNDEIADAHWLRADVDRHLLERARAEGVRVLDGASVSDAREQGDHVVLTLGDHDPLVTRFAVDASGPAAVVARALGARPLAEPSRVRSGFAGCHVRGHVPLDELLAEAGTPLEAGPYPASWAAVHHLLDEGWIYALRFDDGRTSVGLLLDGGLPAGTDPGAIFGKTVGRYPSLAACFLDARPIEHWLSAERVQRRLDRALGRSWACLPGAFAFSDALFSTGIAWTLRGAARLADLIERAAAGGDSRPAPTDLRRYGELLSEEADYIDRLVAGAHAARRDPRSFAAHAMIYFAAVSWAESRQRLAPSSDDAWDGFLGVGDEVLHALPEAALERLGGSGVGPAPSPDEFIAWVGNAIAPRNVAGLHDPAKRYLYPADPTDLVRSAHLLGLEPEEVEGALPRLLGG